MAEKILEVKNLKKYFKTGAGFVHAVDDVTFSINKGETLGIVGESGCGKSTTGRCILRLIEPTAGKVIFEGKDICDFSRREMNRARKDMQIIFQDPYSSLNPRKTVQEIITEPIKHNKIMPGASKAQILNLLKELQRSRGLTYIFITHDLSVVNHFSEDIVVMYLGQAVEKAPAEELFTNPLHPYTKALLSAILIPEVGANKERIQLRGEITSPLDPPDECRFAKRCNDFCDACKKGTPPLVEVSPGHFTACHLI